MLTRLAVREREGGQETVIETVVRNKSKGVERFKVGKA
jgi:hypothetical protein